MSAPRCAGTVAVAAILAAASASTAGGSRPATAGTPRPARTYYVSATGSDDSSGLSPGAAWRSTDRVNRADFCCGDSVLLEGGQTFAGGLQFDARDAGTPDRPVTIGSFGTGRATVLAHRGSGIVVRDAGGFRVTNLRVVGAGDTKGHGVAVTNGRPGDAKLDFIRIDSVEASGFRGWGILVAGRRGRSGFRDVRITHVEAHRNALGGIGVVAEFAPHARGYAHEDVYVGASRAYDNAGLGGWWREHTGDGIMVSDVDRATVEYCVASGNGARSESRTSGPVGIWAWDANAVLIQHNEAFDNRTAGGKDGGGFDLDGGVTNSVMQYNYSHDNDGPGFEIGQFRGARPGGGNSVRYNLSIGDVRKNAHGAIHLFDGAQDVDVYNNTVVVRARPGSASTPRAVKLISWSAPNERVRLRNNLLVAQGGAILVEVQPGQREIRFEGNAYDAAGGQFRVVWSGRDYRSLDDWRRSAGQERLGGRLLGLAADARLVGGAGAAAFRLVSASPLVDAGLDLTLLFGLHPGRRDFFGVEIPQGGAPDIGAHELAHETRSAPRSRAAGARAGRRGGEQ